MISNKASEDANIIWGAVIDENMEDEISVTVIATGFNGDDASVSDDRKPALKDAKKSAKKEVKPQDDDEDDTFYDIMSIFNK